jgi:hypothetical protein
MRHIGDQTRVESLTSRRIKLLRFWNHQVRQELESVLQAIWFAIEEPYNNKNLSPSPSPLQIERRAHLIKSRSILLET